MKRAMIDKMEELQKIFQSPSKSEVPTYIIMSEKGFREMCKIAGKTDEEIEVLVKAFLSEGEL